MAPSTRTLSGIWIALALALSLALFGCSADVPLPPRAVLLNDLGARAFALGDLETAGARFALAVEYHARFTEAWTNLGLVELARGNFELARKDLMKARSLNDHLPAPHHGLGLLADRRGQKDLAARHYAAALRADPGFAPARANLGRIYFEKGAYDEAKDQFLKLTEVEPANLLGWQGLVESLLRLGRESDADLALDRGRAAAGDAPALRVLLARQLVRRAAYAAAEDVLAPLTGATDRGRRGAAWAWIAVARMGKGDGAGALLAAREAALADPDSNLVRYVAGESAAAVLGAAASPGAARGPGAAASVSGGERTPSP